ncbi:MAG: hypothetical protein AAGC81_19665, partial [Pseudomonadota bacterium]
SGTGDQDMISKLVTNALLAGALVMGAASFEDRAAAAFEQLAKFTEARAEAARQFETVTGIGPADWRP